MSTDQSNIKVWIPCISKEQLQKLAERIQPVACDIGGKRFYIQVANIFAGYTWDPKLTKRAIGLKKLCDIPTNHPHCGSPLSFEASVADILAQIPAKYLAKIVAFQIVRSPKTADDLNRDKKALNAGYHVALTRLYINR